MQAVSDVDLDIREGEVVGLVGESGCGKSTLGRIVAGIQPQSAGTMEWRGRDVAVMNGSERKAWQLAVQMIFQDPYASLNPRLRVSEIVGEAPRVHGLIERGTQGKYVAQMLDQVGLDGAYATRYPHQFSGGQRQRIGIARALAVKPAFIVCDEAVAALDVSIQAQVLNLFMELRQRPTSPICSSATISQWSSISPIAWPSCTLAAWSKWRPPRNCLRTRTIPTRRHCWPKCRRSILRGAPTSRSRANCPRRSIHRPAAPSIRAARAHSHAARSSGRR